MDIDEKKLGITSSGKTVFLNSIKTSIGFSKFDHVEAAKYHSEAAKIQEELSIDEGSIELWQLHKRSEEYHNDQSLLKT